MRDVCHRGREILKSGIEHSRRDQPEQVAQILPMAWEDVLMGWDAQAEAERETNDPASIGE